jgi:hypothetical protein
MSVKSEKGRGQYIAEESSDVVIKVLAQEVQGFSNGYHSEKQDDIEAHTDALRTRTEELDDFVKLHGVLHVAWGVSHIFPSSVTKYYAKR